MANLIRGAFLITWGIVCKKLGGSETLMFIGYLYLLVTNICSIASR